MSKLTLEFEFEKQTKNTVRFQEVVGDDEIEYVGAIYIKKHALKDLDWNEDKNIELTIEAI